MEVPEAETAPDVEHPAATQQSLSDQAIGRFLELAADNPDVSPRVRTALAQLAARDLLTRHQIFTNVNEAVATEHESAPSDAPTSPRRASAS
jgi:hypothetical protein